MQVKLVVIVVVVVIWLVIETSVQCTKLKQRHPILLRKSQVTFLTIGHDITGLFRNEWHSRIRTILKLVLTVALVEFVAPSKCESCWPTTGVSVLVTNVQTNQTAKLVSKQQKLKNYFSYHKPKTEHS